MHLRAQKARGLGHIQDKVHDVIAVFNCSGGEGKCLRLPPPSWRLLTGPTRTLAELLVWCDVHVCISVCGDASIHGAAAAVVIVSEGDRKLLNSQACRVACLVVSRLCEPTVMCLSDHLQLP